jgi:dihydrofolate reductase
MKLISIVAASTNNVIGIDNKMPWHLPDDLKFFKQTTLNAPIIMGRNTWLSLGEKPLPKRINIVITRQKAIQAEGVHFVASLDEAIELIGALAPGTEKAFIIGGGQLYASTMNLIAEMYITRIQAAIDNGAVFFPEFSEDDWFLQTSVTHPKDEKHVYEFSFEHWIRKAEN